MTNTHTTRLRETLCQLAHERGWTIEESPKQLAETAFRSVSQARSLGIAATVETREQVDTDFLGIAFNSCSVLISALAADLALWEEGLQKAHQRAAIARSWLLGGSDVDLYLFLVGPAGSGNQEPWQDIARMIERDERICRKLVWLPADEGEKLPYEIGLRKFCERTFISEPWLTTNQGAQHDLDPLGALERELGPEFTKIASLPETVLRNWLRILDRQTDGQKIAQALIASFQDE